MKQCACKDWKPNIEIINGFISMQTVMAWGNKDGYTGKPLVYCPWCGKKLKEVKEPKWKDTTKEQDPNDGGGWK